LVLLLCFSVFFSVFLLFLILPMLLGLKNWRRFQFVTESRAVTTPRAFSRALFASVFFFNWAPVTSELKTHPIQHPPVPSAKQPTHHHDHLEWLLRGGSNIQHSNGHFYDRRSIVLVNRETFKLPINQCGFHVDQLWVHLPNSAFNKMLVRCIFK